MPHYATFSSQLTHHSRLLYLYCHFCAVFHRLVLERTDADDEHQQQDQGKNCDGNYVHLHSCPLSFLCHQSLTCFVLSGLTKKLSYSESASNFPTTTPKRNAFETKNAFLFGGVTPLPFYSRPPVFCRIPRSAKSSYLDTNTRSQKLYPKPRAPPGARTPPTSLVGENLRSNRGYFCLSDEMRLCWGFSFLTRHERPRSSQGQHTCTRSPSTPSLTSVRRKQPIKVKGGFLAHHTAPRLPPKVLINKREWRCSPRAPIPPNAVN